MAERGHVLGARGGYPQDDLHITAVEKQRRSLRKIKPRAFGTPLRGLGAYPFDASKQKNCRATTASSSMQQAWPHLHGDFLHKAADIPGGGVFVTRSPSVHPRQTFETPARTIAAQADSLGPPEQPPHRKTRLRWHHRMKTYTDQTRDQYMPGAPSRKARQSRSTAAGSSPTGAMACGSRRV